MPVRGSFTSDGDEYHYNVESYRVLGNDHDYVRGISEGRLDSDELDFCRVHVTRDDGFDQYVTLWGPHIDQDLLEGELEIMFEEGDYG